MSAYQTVLDDVVDRLEAVVMGCSSFDVDSVHFDYVRTEDYGEHDPMCLLSLVRDSVEDIGPKETQHTLTFQARVSHVGTGTKENLGEIIAYVGEIIDKIESSRTLGSNYIENTEIMNVEYSMTAPQNFVIYSAFMTIEVLCLRNA